MKRSLALLGGVAFMAMSAPASADTRGDIGVYGGVSQRVLVNPGGGAALPGPMFGLHGHIALLPLLRLGLYFHGELAPTDDPVATTLMLGGGVRAKVTPPWPRGSVRIWAAIGAGFMIANSPAFTGTLIRNTNVTGSADAAGGSFIEIPISVGISYRIRKPLVIFAELTTRFGIGFWGSLYGYRGAESATAGPVALGARGDDVFAAGLALGFGFDL